MKATCHPERRSRGELCVAAAHPVTMSFTPLFLGELAARGAVAKAALPFSRERRKA